ncbi:hypothetical protein [Streptomyces sp. SCL15-6]|uniref:hypothetical protein n=1 Tax=Streptomyces sp. SCL15-6 TaxID=2967222 RepID=UPI002966C620|nr:hypothetical protein [Streptomyces sp. SCL15-6]
MRSGRRLRKLVVDGTTTYVWSVRHRHSVTEPCQEVLTLSRDGTRTRLLFRGGEGRFVPDGFLPSGCVAVGDESLNLHEPGVVRAFADEAARRGLLGRPAELDGWDLFAAVAAARTADG